MSQTAEPVYTFTGSELVTEFATEPVMGQVVKGSVRLISDAKLKRFWSKGGEGEKITAQHGEEFAEATLIAQQIYSWNVADEKGYRLDPSPEIVSLFPQQIYLQLVAIVLGRHADPVKKK